MKASALLSVVVDTTYKETRTTFEGSPILN